LLPNVTMSWCKRQAECACGCKTMITVATPMLMVMYWNKSNEGNQSFNTRKYYIPEHWMTQGMEYLNMHPYEPGSPRGPKIELADGDRRKRQLLLRKYGSYKFRMKNLKGSLPDRLLAEIKLESQMSSIMLEISKIGGIPKSWLT
jgi:hypothetical protein